MWQMDPTSLHSHHSEEKMILRAKSGSEMSKFAILVRGVQCVKCQSGRERYVEDYHEFQVLTFPHYSIGIQRTWKDSLWQS